MLFKGPFLTPLVTKTPDEIFSGDGTVMSPQCQMRGYWNPEHYAGAGIIYYNLVSGQRDLELKNGITFNSGESPKCFQADGTDDYIGPVGGNYNPKFTIDHGQPWSICLWVKFDVETGRMFSPKNPIVEIGRVLPGSQTNGFVMSEWLHSFYSQAGSFNQFVEYVRPPTPKTGEWYFLGATKLGTNGSHIYSDYDFYVDGRYTITQSNEGSSFQFAHALGLRELSLGRMNGEAVDGDTSVYAAPGTKFGEVMVYSGNIGLSRMIQNYNATKEKYNKSQNNF